VRDKKDIAFLSASLEAAAIFINVTGNYDCHLRISAKGQYIVGLDRDATSPGVEYPCFSGGAFLIGEAIGGLEAEDIKPAARYPFLIYKMVQSRMRALLNGRPFVTDVALLPQ